MCIGPPRGYVKRCARTARRRRSGSGGVTEFLSCLRNRNKSTAFAYSYGTVGYYALVQHARRLHEKLHFRDDFS